jgi:hypothetical protein
VIEFGIGKVCSANDRCVDKIICKKTAWPSSYAYIRLERPSVVQPMYIQLKSVKTMSYMLCGGFKGVRIFHNPFTIRNHIGSIATSSHWIFQ